MVKVGDGEGDAGFGFCWRPLLVANDNFFEVARCHADFEGQKILALGVGDIPLCEVA